MSTVVGTVKAPLSKTGFRFRCYPTRAQEQTLLQWIGHQQFIYNAKVGEDRYFRAGNHR